LQQLFAADHLARRGEGDFDSVEAGFQVSFTSTGSPSARDGH
jgi:hypothetical protein